MAAPPLMHRKGHAGSGDQQRHQDDHGFGRCRFTCALSASRGRADERAFHLLLNALYRASADAAFTRDLAYAFAATQMRLDALFKRGIDPRPAELRALCDRALKASVDALPDHAALKLGERAADLKHELAGRRRGVDRLLVEVEIDAAGLQRLDGAQQVDQASSDAINTPRHDDVELAPGRASLSIWSRPGRPSRPFAPLMPASLYCSTTSQPRRSAIWRKAVTWFSTVCLSVDTRT